MSWVIFQLDTIILEDLLAFSFEQMSQLLRALSWQDLRKIVNIFIDPSQEMENKFIHMYFSVRGQMKIGNTRFSF